METILTGYLWLNFYLFVFTLLALQLAAVVGGIVLALYLLSQLIKPVFPKKHPA
jgi:hypothetical protein